jgi:hypothetical protein
MGFHWTNDNRSWYRQVYLRSDHWKNLRTAKLEATPICEICKREKAVEPHHKRYKQIFDVTLDDLLSVCRACHDEIHRREGMPKRKRPKFQKMSSDQRAAIKANNAPIFKRKFEARLARRLARKQKSNRPF